MELKYNKMNKEELQKYTDELNKHKYLCSCGRKVYIDRKKEKAVCDWCGKYVFKNKIDEFKYRMKEKLKNE